MTRASDFSTESASFTDISGCQMDFTPSLVRVSCDLSGWLLPGRKGAAPQVPERQMRPFHVVTGHGVRQPSGILQANQIKWFKTASKVSRVALMPYGPLPRAPQNAWELPREAFTESCK